MKEVKTMPLLPVTVAAASLVMLACYSGGGSGGNQSGQMTTINGRGSDIIAMKGLGNKSIRFAELMDMLSFVK